MLLDIVFSLDSVITAVGLSQHIFIMIAAEILALTFLLFVGVLLVADSLNIHIAKEYLYFAIFFSLSVETLNIIRERRKFRH